MKCIKCKKTIPTNSKFCNHCGEKQPKDGHKSKYYVRSDGLHESIRIINGERVPFRGKTDAEVDRKILEFTGKVEKGSLFKDIAEEWEEQHFPTLAENTLRGYRPALRRAIDQFGKKRVKEITARQIEAYIKEFSAPGIAKQTATTQLQIIRQILDLARLKGEIMYNPAEAVKVPKTLTRSKRELPSDEEINKVKSAPPTDFGLLAMFILYTGCRRGEALAITNEDIDRENKVIHISKSVYYTKGHRPHLKTPKTASGKRTVPLLDSLDEALPRELRKGYLFSADGSEPWHEYQVDTGWNRLREEIGITASPHQLRHGYATILFDAGLEPKDAQELLGHAQIATTMDIYTHIRQERREKSEVKINSYLKGESTANTQ